MDKMSLFFHKYLKIIIASICLILVLFTGHYFWQQHNDNLTIAAANEYDEAVGADSENRVKLLQKIVDSNNNIFKVMAQLKLAEIADKNKDFHKAAYYYKEVVKNNKAPQEHADYAELMLVKTEILLKKNKDSENILLLENYINSKKIFKNLARFYLASIYIDNGQKKEAQNQLNYLLTNQLSGDAGYIMPLAKELMKKAQTN